MWGKALSWEMEGKSWHLAEAERERERERDLLPVQRKFSTPSYNEVLSAEKDWNHLQNKTRYMQVKHQKTRAKIEDSMY